MTKKKTKNQNTELLKIYHEIRAMHHDALWEEEKHFSWWVYSIFAGIFFVFSYTGLTLSLKIILTILLSISGIKLCHSALDIINSEQTYFTSALEKFKKHYTDN